MPRKTTSAKRTFEETPREREIEAHLVRKALKMGGRALKFVSPGLAGVPDRLVILPTKEGWHPRYLFIEVKAPGKRATPRQQAVHNALRKYGCEVHVVDSAARINEILEWHTTIWA